MSHLDDLIRRLSAEAGPVRRLSPAWARAAVLAPLMLGLGFVATTALRLAVGGWTAPIGGLRFANAALSLCLGTAGLFQALTLGVPGARVRGGSAMLAAAAAWLAVSAAGMRAHGATDVGPGGRPLCFAFLLVAGLPMVAVVIVALRRARPLQPMRSLVLAGGGVTFLSYGLLAFCHPAEISVGDFVAHLMAGATLGLLTLGVGRRIVAL